MAVGRKCKQPDDRVELGVEYLQTSRQVLVLQFRHLRMLCQSGFDHNARSGGLPFFFRDPPNLDRQEMPPLGSILSASDKAYPHLFPGSHPFQPESLHVCKIQEISSHEPASDKTRSSSVLSQGKSDDLRSPIKKKADAACPKGCPPTSRAPRGTYGGNRRRGVTF